MDHPDIIVCNFMEKKYLVSKALMAAANLNKNWYSTIQAIV